MGPITLTSDRVWASFQARAMIAASTVNALGLDIADTNISVTTAWRRAQDVRLKTSSNIKQNYKPPENSIVHWDGKIVNLKGNSTSNRVCVYVSGAGNDTSKKLLSVPETPNGTGEAEARVVTDSLESWNIKEEVKGIVFDTTSSNSGAHSGACKLSRFGLAGQYSG